VRELIRDFVRIAAKTLPVSQPVYEFGSLQVANQVGFADLREFFPGKQYVGCDIREGPGVDRVLDLHDIELDSDCSGVVLLLDTLEHVERPRRALEEVYRILQPGGIVIMSSVMNFPIHNHPHDYWRFTPEAFRSILKVFNQTYVEFAGEAHFPHTVVGVGIKDAKVSILELQTEIEIWKEKWRDPLGRRWIGYVKPLVPPILFHAYSVWLRLRARGRS
jgi:SAM-dependent methyltransferase